MSKKPTIHFQNGSRMVIDTSLSDSEKVRGNSNALLRKPKILGRNDTVYFGKYKGRKISQILEWDASYLVWAAENVNGFAIEAEIYEQAMDIFVQEESEKISEFDIYDYYDRD